MGLFGNQKSEKPAPTASAPITASSQPASPVAQPRNQYTVLGQGLDIIGEMISDEDVVIEGKFSGKLSCSARITVGRTGQVEAELSGSIIQISGRVKGNLTAKQKIEIIATGYLEGNICTPKVIVAEGAIFKGNVEMPTEQLQAQRATEQPAAQPAATTAANRPKK